MPSPIDPTKITSGAGATVRTETSDGKTSAKFDQFREAAGTEGKPRVAEAGNVNTRQVEHDLRKRLEAARSTDPAKVFGPDLGEARKRIDQIHKRIDGVKHSAESSPLRDRLAALEAQFNASEKRLHTIPDTDNLRDLLAMQVEMSKLGQNIEILSKVIDAATSGIKSTLQMQV